MFAFHMQNLRKFNVVDMDDVARTSNSPLPPPPPQAAPTAGDEQSDRAADGGEPAAEASSTQPPPLALSGAQQQLPAYFLFALSTTLQDRIVRRADLNWFSQNLETLFKQVSFFFSFRLLLLIHFLDADGSRGRSRVYFVFCSYNYLHICTSILCRLQTWPEVDFTSLSSAKYTYISFEPNFQLHRSAIARLSDMSASVSDSSATPIAVDVSAEGSSAVADSPADTGGARESDQKAARRPA